MVRVSGCQTRNKKGVSVKNFATAQICTTAFFNKNLYFGQIPNAKATLFSRINSASLVRAVHALLIAQFAAKIRKASDFASRDTKAKVAFEADAVEAPSIS